ncbi:hypothetical protein BGX38DRAFT_1144418 [Terfezia claveryi]|nr:hypothetical protein BGX38DRAFT_1144418 [Terfezia claveryi]
MRPPRRRHSKPVSTRRYLALRHGHRVLKALESGVLSDANGSTLPTGYERLYSSDVPGLHAGIHRIDVKQTIQAREGEPGLNVTGCQQFNVVAPKFVLPPEAVYSVYPHPGHSARPEVLAHVVMNDPTLPWERYASENAERNNPDDYQWNRVPWLAVLVFSPDELKLSDAQLTGANSIFKETSFNAQGATHTDTMAVEIPVSDLPKLDKSQVAVPATFQDAEISAEEAKLTANVVFLEKDLFNNLVAKYDKDGRIVNGGGSDAPDVSRYRFLAHLRHINTEGMAYADEVDIGEDSDRNFGIIVGHRTGPLTTQNPVQVAVHLVSIEGVERMKPYPVEQGRVALISLYSWTYMCLPANSANVADMFENLGQGSNCAPLRPVLPKDNKPTQGVKPEVQARVLKRVEDGYSLTRYITQTGERTAAFTRGPLTPSMVSFPLFTTLSKSGASLQTMDRQLGIMDITYSAAWQLGRTLGMADQAFTAALGRVRKEILQEGHNEAQIKVLHTAGISYKRKEELIKGMAKLMQCLKDLPEDREKEGGSELRWKKNRPEVPNLSYNSIDIQQIIDGELLKAAYRVGGSVIQAGNTLGVDGISPAYDEFNTAASTDWMIVHRFLCDLTYLINVPPHYLITDPSNLPAESLRFFYIDRNWLDALADGALSLANHIDCEEDRVRRAIKEAFNRYFNTPNNKLNYRPPVPVYGFFLRSALVVQFPDMVVTTDPALNKLQGPVLLRHEIIDKEIMLCFLSDLPQWSETENKLISLTFTQPAHQQSFAASRNISATEIRMHYKRVYTVANPSDPDRNVALEEPVWERGLANERGTIFVWGSAPEKLDNIRTLIMDNFAKDVHTSLKTKLNEPPVGKEGWFTEPVPTSAMIGIQLNDPCWQLKVQVPPLSKLPLAPMRLTYTTPTIPTERKSVKPPKLSPIAPRPTFAERNKSPLLICTKSAPYFRPVIPALLAEPIFRPRDDGDTVRYPTFAYHVSPAEDPRSADVYMRPYPQDLIFSIRYQTGALDFKLKKVTISLPVGVMNDRSLTAKYSGPGATMLSNLRFVVRPTYSANKQSLDLVLLPRSRSKMVPVKLIKEMSFLLSGVRVMKYELPSVSVTVGVVVDYDNRAPIIEIPFNIVLVPVKATDEQIVN